MEDFKERILGRTGLKVGRLGIAASYGAPAEAFEEAFEKGCNYFYWGSGRRKDGMTQAIRNLCSNGMRDKLVISVQTYARMGFLGERSLKKTLRVLGLEQADILMLGWHNSQPSPRIIDKAMEMKEKGLFKFLGMSGHNRKLFPEMEKTGSFDLFHIRYNAAHRGAEQESFPQLAGDNQPGIVTYTATRWGHLLNPKKMPQGESVPAPADCYRFVMSNPAVDVCLCGPKNDSQMQAALPALELGPLADEEMERMKMIGNHVHQKNRLFF